MIICVVVEVLNTFGMLFISRSQEKWIKSLIKLNKLWRKKNSENKEWENFNLKKVNKNITLIIINTFLKTRSRKKCERNERTLNDVFSFVLTVSRVVFFFIIRILFICCHFYCWDFKGFHAVRLTDGCHSNGRSHTSKSLSQK